MNRVFRLVWNRTLGRVVVTSEAARSVDKANGARGRVGAVAATGRSALASLSRFVPTPLVAAILMATSLPLSAQQTVETTVDPDVISFITGDNLLVSLEETNDGTNDTAEFTLELDPDLEVDSLTITNGPSLTANGIDAGNNVISNVADGVAAGDAVNFGQFEPVKDLVDSIDFDLFTEGEGIKYFRANSSNDDAQATGFNAIAIGPNAEARRNNSFAAGDGAEAYTKRGISIGFRAGEGSIGGFNDDRVSHIAIGDQAGQNVDGNENIAIGSGTGSDVTGDQNTALGNRAGTFAEGNFNTSIGNNANNLTATELISRATAVGAASSAETDGTALGYNASASSQGTAFGSGADAGKGSVAIGQNTVASSGDIALGTGSEALADDKTGTGYITGSAFDGTVLSIGNSGGSGGGVQRRIVNVADGANDYDAINVRQLEASQQSVANLVGGNVTLEDDGTYSGYVIELEDGSGNNQQYGTVAEAINAVSSGAISVFPGDAVIYNPDGTIDIEDGQLANQAVSVSQLNETVAENAVEYFSVNASELQNEDNSGATGVSATAIGPVATAAGDFSLAAGHQVNAAEEQSTAIGFNVAALGKNSTVLGNNSDAYDDGGVAIGQRAVSQGENTITMGTNAQADPNSGNSVDNSIVIGTDAESIAEEGIAIGQSALASSDRAVAQGSDAHATGLNALAFGTDSRARATDSQASGTNADARSRDSQASGTNALARGAGAIATGTDSITRANNAIATGTESQANGEDSIATGTESQADEVDSIAIGTQSQAIVEGGVALGAGSLADTAAGEIGYKPFGATAADSDAIDATEATQSAVDVGSRQITSLAAGTQDDDAVNVSQLIASQSKVEAGTNTAVTTSDNPDGGTIYTVDADGTTVSNGSDAVTVTPTGPDADNVTDYAVDLSQDSKDSLENANKGWDLTANGEATGENIAPGETADFSEGQNIAITRTGNSIEVATADDVEFNQVTIGDATDPANSTVLTNVDGALDVSGDQITNVADGDISDTSTDAINGSQLFATNTNVTNNTTEINKGLNFGDGDTSNNYALGDTINVNGDANVTSTTSADGVQLGLADVITVGSTNPVTIDGDTGTIGGLTNTTFDPDNFTSGQAATEDQLSNVIGQVADAGAGWDVQVNAETADNVASGETVQFVDGQNIAITRDSDQVIKVATADDVEFNQVTIGDATDSTTSTVLTNVDGALDVSGDQITGVESGLTGTTLATAEGDDLTNAVNVGDLQDVSTAENGGGFGLADTGGEKVTQDLGETITVTDPDGNITTTADNDAGELQLGLGNDLTIGDDEAPGSITVNGQDGEDGIALNGKDGTIGLTGPAGPNGTDGLTTISIQDGEPGVDGVDGDTRIVYTDPEGNDQEVATLEDGLNFAGNTGDTIAKELNDTLNIEGELADGDAASGANLRVDSDGDKLNLVMARNLTELDSATFGEAGADDQFTINKDGVQFVNDAGDQRVDTPSIAADGIDGGNNQITGVESGLTGTTLADAEGDDLTNAVNVGDLQDVSTAENGGGFGLADTGGEKVTQDLGETITVTDPDGNITTTADNDAGELQLGLGSDLTIGDDGEPGSITIVGEDGIDGKDGIALNGKDGTIGLAGPAGQDGTDGLTTISIQDGEPGVDGVDGETSTRIVYTDPDGNDQEVATLEDGLNFAGNTGDTIAKELNDTLNIEGELADGDAASGANLRVDSAEGQLNLVMARNLTELDSATFGEVGADDQFTINKDGVQFVNDAGDQRVDTPSIAEDGIDGGNNQITGVESGLTGTTLADAEGDDLTNAVNVGDLQDVSTAENGGGFGLADTGGEKVTQDLGETITVTDPDGNITTTADDDAGELQLGLGNDLTIGEDGEPGSITVNGQDGEDGIALNGEDGTIGLAGPAGQDGTDGLTTIAIREGAPGVDGVDGVDGDTRIVYTDPDGNDQEVATLEDGLNFAGNTGDTIAKELNDTLNIEGELADGDAASGANLRVDSAEGQLNLVMARNLTELDSATFGEPGTNDQFTINKDGVQFVDAAGDQRVDTPSIAADGIDGGNKQITGVESGLAGTTLADAEGDDLTNAVNVGDLQDVSTAENGGGFGLADTGGEKVTQDLGETITVTDPDGNITTTADDDAGELQLGLGNDLTIGEDGEPGSITVNGQDGEDGIVLNGEDGSIGLTGEDGANGTITVVDGEPGVDGQDGITRIEVDDIEVATLEDGLKFGANDGDVHNAELNTQVDITGAADNDDWSAFDEGQNIMTQVDDNNITVALAKDLTGLDSATFVNSNGNDRFTINENGVEFVDVNGDRDETAPSIAADGIDGGENQITGVGSGLGGDKLGDITGDDLNNAVNVGDLQDVSTAENGGGFGLADTDGATVTQDLGETITVTDPDGNITTTADNEAGELQLGLGNDLTIGDDEAPGSITVTGEDGEDGIVLNGEDGSIGLTGEDGANGTITVVDGEPGVDGQDGITRIEVDDIEVATLEDGLKFVGDDGEVVERKLNETLGLTGGADVDALSDNNIGITKNDDGSLAVQLAKNLTDLDSITINNGGPVINKDGIDMGGDQITNLGSGKTDTNGNAVTDIADANPDNAANIDDLQDVNDVANAGWDVATSDTTGTATSNVGPDGEVDFVSADDSIVVEHTRDDKTGNTSIDFALGNDLTIGDDNEPGSIVINGKDGKDGVTINGEDGTIGLTGKDGKNGTIGIDGINGSPGVNGTDGITRIVYEDGEGNDYEVATLDDGLKFTGNDDSVEIAKNLNETLTVKGGLDNAEDATDANTRVDVEDGNLVVKLAKDLTDLDSITINDGPTLNNNGIDMGGLDTNGEPTNKITNLAPGTDGTDAVNVDQLTDVEDIASAGWDVLTSDTTNDAFSNVAPNGKVDFVSEDGSIVVEHTRDDQTGNTSIDFGLGNELTVGEDGDAGSITVTGEDGEDGIVLNGEDGSIGLTGEDGANGTITVVDGEPGVDGQDGITRIEVDDIEVATLEDGLKFVGDDGEVVERKLNETLGLTGGADTDALTDDNIGITQDDEGGLKVQLAENVDLGSDGSVKAGDSSLDTDGLVVNDSTDNPTATTEVEAGRITLSANPTTGPANEIAIDANTGTIGGLTNTTFDADATYTGGQAATQEQLGQVYNVANAGWNVSTGGEGALDDGSNNVGPNGVVDFSNSDDNIRIDREGTDLAFNLNPALDLGEEGSVTIGDTVMNNDGVSVGDDVQLGNEGLVIADGPSVTSSGIDAGNSVITNVLPGEEDTDAVNVSQLKDGVAAASTEVKAGDNINVSEADGDNGQTIYTVETQRDVDFDSIEVGSVDIDQGNVDENGNTVITGMGRGDISENSTDAVNGSQLWDVQQGLGDINESLTGGRDFAADEGKTINRKLDETLTVSGDQNITTKTSERGVQVTLERDLDVDSVTTGGTTINDNGLTIEDGPSVTRDGVDAGGEVITNVAPGVEASDAVNVGQMNELGQRFQNEINNVNGRIDDVEKNANAGSASAIAASSVPQAWRSGESMVSVGAGTYGGESAVAVGVSRLSDNGRWIIQGKVTGDSQGEFGAGVGAGWHW
ncbi:YadA-like family protein [Vreelandella aquamarina]|uniref:YadA-like family protein n=1 Tax=Vreelandella aquamarina TaxID=77097 RepID=UPI00384D5120